MFLSLYKASGFVLAVQSTRIRASAGEWIELAPAFAKDPQQLVLAGDSSSDVLVKGAIVPPGTYRELQIKLFSGRQEDASQVIRESTCGAGQWNCIMTSDGRIEPLSGRGDSPEVIVPFEAAGGTALVVLPNSATEVQVNWAVQTTLASGVGGLSVLNILAGTVEVSKRLPVQGESSASN